MNISLESWDTRPRPQPVRLEGRTVFLEAFSEDKHGQALWQALGGDDGANARIHYFPDAPYRDGQHFSQAYGAIQTEWLTMVIHSAQSDQVVGMASFMRIRPEHGSVEIGAVAHGEAMARSAMSTEAHYLLARYVFEGLGYRRYEWKLNDTNLPSHKAAQRLGFTFEGTFRQDMVVRNAQGALENRNTAWYSMLDSEWPSRKAALEAWLTPTNFDEDGRQRKTLESLRR